MVLYQMPHSKKHFICNKSQSHLICQSVKHAQITYTDVGAHTHSQREYIKHLINILYNSLANKAENIYAACARIHTLCECEYTCLLSSRWDRGGVSGAKE